MPPTPSTDPARDFNLLGHLPFSGQPHLPFTALQFGFIGAYWFILQDLTRRYFRQDLKTAAYVSASVRLIVVTITVGEHPDRLGGSGAALPVHAQGVRRPPATGGPADVRHQDGDGPDAGMGLHPAVGPRDPRPHRHGAGRDEETGTATAEAILASMAGSPNLGHVREFRGHSWLAA